MPAPTAASGSASFSAASQIAKVVQNLDAVNASLRDAEPQQILEWAIDNLPGLYQTTAFGVTGCVTLDLVSRISQQRAAAAGTVSGDEDQRGAYMELTLAA